MSSAALIRANQIRLPIVIHEQSLIPSALLEHILNLILHGFHLEITRRRITGGKEDAVIVLGHQYILFRLCTVGNAHASNPVGPAKILGICRQNIVLKLPVHKILGRIASHRAKGSIVHLFGRICGICVCAVVVHAVPVISIPELKYAAALRIDVVSGCVLPKRIVVNSVSNCRCCWLRTSRWTD